MKAKNNQWLILTGCIGLLAALLVGTGEFLGNMKDFIYRN